MRSITLPCWWGSGGTGHTGQLCRKKGEVKNPLLYLQSLSKGDATFIKSQQKRQTWTLMETWRKFTWRKRHCQQTLWEGELLGVIIAPPLKREPHRTLKGRVQTHIWEEPGGTSCSLLWDFRKQMATGNLQFHQELCQAWRPALSPLPTRFHWEWFYVSTWAWQPHKTLPLKPQDNAIQQELPSSFFFFKFS